MLVDRVWARAALTRVEVAIATLAAGLDLRSPLAVEDEAIRSPGVAGWTSLLIAWAVPARGLLTPAWLLHVTL